MPQNSVTLLSIGSLLVVVASSLSDHVARRRSRRVPRGAAERSPSLYELAYLAGGVRRVVVTALAALARAGVVRFDTDGHVQAVAVGGREDAIEADIIHRLSSRDDRRPVTELCAEMPESAAITALAERLTRQKLLLPAAYRPPVWSRRLLGLAISIAGAAAVISILTGHLLGAVLAVVAVGIGVVAWRRGFRLNKTPLTDAGNYVLANTLTRNRQGEIPGMADVAVAMIGSLGLINPEVRRGLQIAEAFPVGNAEDSWTWKPTQTPPKDYAGGSGDQFGGLPPGAGLI
ncbi:TIGR04222 domain-containing membrane protein [Microtetraspora malaysiensis]|uniref:TIGR04222 domain-containing membrane protein n=1 Tax=Microtetraspora malaysiensis TaxID=161358 RepID=UPI003D89D0C4